MNKLKIGVIGAGWWATENHIPHLLERSEVELTSAVSYTHLRAHETDS